MKLSLKVKKYLIIVAVILLVILLSLFGRYIQTLDKITIVTVNEELENIPNISEPNASHCKETGTICWRPNVDYFTNKTEFYFYLGSAKCDFDYDVNESYDFRVTLTISEKNCNENLIPKNAYHSFKINNIIVDNIRGGLRLRLFKFIYKLENGVATSEKVFNLNEN